MPEGCLQNIVDVLNETLKKDIDQTQMKQWFDVRQNALIIKNAESYYRAMVFGKEDSWNVRDQHMMSTLETLLEHYGTDSKVIVWEHNTHIGDYRATDMVKQGQMNVGGLAREIFGSENVALVGFGTYSGTVTASNAWEGPTMKFDIPEARKGSVEHACHSIIEKVQSPNFYLIFDSENQKSQLSQVRDHRAIGVVYDPDIEHRGNYVPTSLSKRYDAFVYLDYTHSVSPLNVISSKHQFPDIYPYGNRI
jgi:erythromycin esterase-like protein